MGTMGTRHHFSETTCHAKTGFYQACTMDEWDDSDIKQVQGAHGSLLVWASSIRSRGGVCRRHWTALLRKQVFPVL